MRFVKDKFFSGLFSFTSSKAWIWLSLIFSVGMMGLLGIKGQDALNYGWLFGVFVVLFIGLPLFFRFKYFREIPENMSREQYDDWKKVEPFIVPDKFHIPPYWLGVIVTCAVFVGLAVAYKNSEFLVFIPPVLIVSLFGFVAMKLIKERKETSLSNALMKNAMAEYQSDMEARHGIHYRKWVLGFMACNIFGLISMFFYVPLGIVLFFGGMIIFIIGKREKKTIEYFE